MSIAAQAWECLGLDADLLDLLQSTPVPLPSRLAVGRLAADSVAVASLAAQLVLAERRGRRPGPVQVDGVRVAGSFRSDRLLRIDGRPVQGFAPLSGFWPAVDGWVRTHGNYPHHARRLRELLGLGPEAGPEQLRAELARRPVLELEDAAAAGGALLVAVREPAAWRAHPQARAVAEAPLVVREHLGDAPARRWSDRPERPLAGIRVLDLTRVIAGPVAGRDLALAGADVLRIDPPTPAEISWQHLDTGQDKRSALLDLAGQRERFEELLAGADVVLTGYRPGALDRFGLTPHALAERRPGIVVGRISAWGGTGPWSGRRGFDSLVQAGTGIAVLESPDGVTPGALPAQALDHASGHLLAAGVIAALRAQRRDGGSAGVTVSLARTAGALLQLPGDTAAPSTGPAWPLDSGGGVICAAPVLTFDGAPRTYTRIGAPWGADPAEWAATP
ncbi:CoA transferase [Modestobacter altitudinis]|uniref:CoA transferase n=1 Tax=Modestobacter altitudinis TaxID=2213158 RepID=UPI00110CEE35|nr:CoA transferase [Modestobacter altitudinis]